MKSARMLTLLCLAAIPAAAVERSGTAVAAGNAVSAPLGTRSNGPRVVELAQYLGTVEITCTDFTAAGTGAAVLDRDNTGSGSETSRIDVVDGIGTVLYTLTFSNALGSYAGGLIGTTPYDVAPQANPITVTWTSFAGNGFAEQLALNVTGTCAGLSALAVPAVSVRGLLALGLALAAAAFLVLRGRRQTAA